MIKVGSNGLPVAQGLYDPRYEHDACGIGFVANFKGQKSHDIIKKGIQVLTDTRAESISLKGDGVQISLDQDGSQADLEVAALLVAVGRRL